MPLKGIQEGGADLQQLPESLDQQHCARREDSELITHRSEAAIGLGRIDGMRCQDDEIDVVRANEPKH
jgi:hypothetical protein